MGFTLVQQQDSNGVYLGFNGRIILGFTFGSTVRF